MRECLIGVVDTGQGAHDVGYLYVWLACMMSGIILSRVGSYEIRRIIQFSYITRISKFAPYHPILGTYFSCIFGVNSPIEALSYPRSPNFAQLSKMKHSLTCFIKKKSLGPLEGGILKNMEFVGVVRG